MGSLRDWPSLVHQSCIAVKTPAVSSRGDNLAKRIVPRHSLFEWNSSLKPVERRHAQLFVFRPPLELRLVQSFGVRFCREGEAPAEPQTECTLSGTSGSAGASPSR